MTVLSESQLQLSDRQQMLLTTIEDFICRHGFPPTIREIIQLTDITSTSLVSYYINQLVRKGLLEKEHKVSRGIKLMARPNVDKLGMVNVPILRKVLTSPLSKIPETGNYQSLPVDWLTNVPISEVYAVRVDTHLMYDAMVNEGDVMVLQHFHETEGDGTVVVMNPTKDEFRIRKIRYDGDCATLEPLMRMFQPQTLPKSQVQVVGKVLGIMRQF